MQIFNVKNDKYLSKCANTLFHVNEKLENYQKINNEYKNKLNIGINQLTIYLNNCIDNKIKFNYYKHDLLFNDNNEIIIKTRKSSPDVDDLCYFIGDIATLFMMDDLEDIYDENIPYNIPEKKTYTLTSKQYKKIEELYDSFDDIAEKISITEQQISKLITYQNSIVKNIRKDLKTKLYTGNNNERYSSNMHDIFIVKNDNNWEFVYTNKLNTNNFINEHKDCKKVNTIQFDL